MDGSRPQVSAVEWQGVSWAPAGQQPLLSDITLRAKRSAITYLVGESGSGKSTLLRMANRLVEPNSGSVAVEGKGVADWEVRALRRHAVYVAQRPVALADTVLEDLQTPLRWHGLTCNVDLLREPLAIAQLSDMPLEHPTLGLSEGQLCRLGLARALALQPKVLLLDEPTAALDPRLSRTLLHALGRWAVEHEACLVCVTHRLHELVELPGDVSVLLAGRLLGPYSQADIRESRVPNAVAEFVGRLESSP